MKILRRSDMLVLLKFHYSTNIKDAKWNIDLILHELLNFNSVISWVW